MQIVVDATKCEGYGACADVCPSHLQLDEWGYASVKGNGQLTAEETASAEAAVAVCPEHAISIKD